MMKKPDLPRLTTELTVGDVAARSGVAVSTLHFYEAKGLSRVGEIKATSAGIREGCYAA